MPFSIPTLLAILLAVASLAAAAWPGVPSDISAALGLAAVVSAVLSLRERR